MPEYNQFMMRHGEYGVQDLIERLERYEGVVANSTLPLEQRWMALESSNSDSCSLAV